MTSGHHPIRSNFWLLDAPRSMREQSYRMPDGAGIGWFTPDGTPMRNRAPVPAHQDPTYENQAQDVSSTMFVSHIRYATTGEVDVHNTHPFQMQDRLFAHNGVVKGLDVLKSWIPTTYRSHIEGGTDSELVFAFITSEIARLGDTTAGLISAITRIGAELPVYALNVILAEKDKMWALRYPDTHELWVLPSVGEQFLSSDNELMRVHARDGEDFPAVVIASEPLDHNPAWRLMAPGELLVADGLRTSSHFPFEAPRHPLTRADLSIHEMAAQEDAQSELALV